VLWFHSYPQLLAPDADSIMSIEALLPAPDDGVLVIAQNYGDRDSLKFIRLDKYGNVLADWWQKIADFPTNFAGAFTNGEQIYLVYHDRAEYGASNSTYIAPFIWPDN